MTPNFDGKSAFGTQVHKFFRNGHGEVLNVIETDANVILVATVVVVVAEYRWHHHRLRMAEKVVLAEDEMRQRCRQPARLSTIDQYIELSAAVMAQIT
jgi:hypothetical protein